jgi:polar amino acid transport system substrate-binding protein
MILFPAEQATATNYRHYSFRTQLLSIALLFAPIFVEADDKLRFVTLDFAPFIYSENQSVAGPGYEIISAVCERAGIDCTFDIYPWRRAQELMRAGKADGMMVIGRNSKREQWIRFTPPHFRTEYGVFVRADNQLDITEVTALAGLRVGVFSPSNTATQLISISEKISNEGLEPINIEKRPDDASGFRKLAVGRLDAVYSNRDRGYMIIEAEGLQNKIRYAGGHQGILYYAGFTRVFADTQLLDRFDKVWEAIFEEGEGQRIIQKYGLEPAP